MRNCFFAALALFLVPPGSPGEPSHDSVTLKVVKYDDLADAVRRLRGKVVVVDFWADYCAPCKHAFPRLVELHRKHAPAGLAAVSVSLDQNTEADRRRVVAFLKKQSATFANCLLDEPAGMWQNKLRVDGPPIVFVFNRKGELVRRMADAEVDYDAVAKLVATLLTE